MISVSNHAVVFDSFGGVVIESFRFKWITLSVNSLGKLTNVYKPRVQMISIIELILLSLLYYFLKEMKLRRNCWQN